MLIKSFYKLLLVHQTLIAPHFLDAEFPKLRLIGILSSLGSKLVLVFQLFRNPGGGGGTGRIGEDDGPGGGWVGAEEDFGGC